MPKKVWWYLLTKCSLMALVCVRLRQPDPKMKDPTEKCFWLRIPTFLCVCWQQRFPLGEILVKATATWQISGTLRSGQHGVKCLWGGVEIGSCRARWHVECCVCVCATHGEVTCHWHENHMSSSKVSRPLFSLGRCVWDLQLPYFSQQMWRNYHKDMMALNFPKDSQPTKYPLY